MNRSGSFEFGGSVEIGGLISVGAVDSEEVGQANAAEVEPASDVLVPHEAAEKPKIEVAGVLENPLNEPPENENVVALWGWNGVAFAASKCFVVVADVPKLKTNGFDGVDAFSGLAGSGCFDSSAGSTFSWLNKEETSDTVLLASGAMERNRQLRYDTSQRPTKQ